LGTIKFYPDKTMKLQDFLRECGVSRRLITRLKRIPDGITRNGELIRTIDSVNAGDVIAIESEDSSLLEPNAELCVPVAFENENLAVFDKPPGMPVHPSIRHQGDTLGNFFAAEYPGLTFRPVNRLDRNTSGLCIIAKNPFSAAALQRNVEKVYYAAVSGDVSGEGTIDAPIAREQESIIKRIVSPAGQRAVTHYRCTGRSEKYSLMEITLETGRTHQIRVHFSYIGHPLAGDDMYGGSREDIDRQALHCGKLTFKEPVTGEMITVESPMADDIKRLFE